MNLTLKMKIENAQRKINGMFGEMPWFCGTEMCVNDTNTEIFFIVYVNSNSVDAQNILNFLNQVKIDKFPIKAELK